MEKNTSRTNAAKKWGGGGITWPSNNIIQKDGKEHAWCQTQRM